MKRKLLYLLSVVLLASCSAPKYTYNFGTYDYQAGKRKAAVLETSAKQIEMAPADQQAAPIELTASTEAMSSTADKTIEPSTLTDVQTSLRERYRQMSASEKKNFRKEVIHASKNYSKALKRGDHIAAEKAVQALDNDLKLAAIFGAIGIVALIIGGDVFWIIGGVALIIGVVFFVKWLLRQ